MDTLAARQQMVDQQIRTWEVLDPRVLDALSAVPREAFVPPEYRELAFADAPIPDRLRPIDAGAEAAGPHSAGARRPARPTPCSKSAAAPAISPPCLSLLGAATHSIDIHPEFVAAAAANLRAVPEANVQFEIRDAFSAAPLGEYDVIAVTGSLPVYDTRFERSLRVGGRLFAMVGAAPVMDAIWCAGSTSDEWIRESLFETVVEPLINAAAAPKFVF